MLCPSRQRALHKTRQAILLGCGPDMNKTSICGSFTMPGSVSGILEALQVNGRPGNAS
jgi:ABC-type iron transport system FetAB permease component